MADHHPEPRAQFSDTPAPSADSAASNAAVQVAEHQYAVSSMPGGLSTSQALRADPFSTEPPTDTGPVSPRSQPDEATIASGLAATTSGRELLPGPPSHSIAGRPKHAVTPRAGELAVLSPVVLRALVASSPIGPSQEPSSIDRRPPQPQLQHAFQSTSQASREGAIASAIPSRLSRGPAPASRSLSEPARGQAAGQQRKGWLQYAVCTSAGRNADGQPKVNQDRFFVHIRLGGLSNVHLFGVCDGHGPNGDQAAEHVATMLPKLLARRLTDEGAPACVRARITIRSSRSASRSVSSSLSSGAESDEGGSTDPPSISRADFDSLVVVLKQVVLETERSLFDSYPGMFDTSGTTLVCVLLFGHHMVIANVGDSRAVLVQQQEPASTQALSPMLPSTGCMILVSGSLTLDDDTDDCAYDNEVTYSKQVGASPSGNMHATDAGSAAWAGDEGTRSGSGSGSGSGAAGALETTTSEFAELSEHVIGEGPRSPPRHRPAGDAAEETPRSRSREIVRVHVHHQEDAKKASVAPDPLVGAGDPGSPITPFPVSEVHKPSTPGERARLLRLGGLVLQRDGGPMRVWTTHPSTGRTAFGLSMSRSIGDGLLVQRGVVCHPSVTYHFLRPGRDRALVIATDGVWDVLTDVQVARATASGGTTVADTVVHICKSAEASWKSSSPPDRHTRDDITAVLLHFWRDLWQAT